MKKFLNQWLPKKETLEKNRYLRALFLNKKTAPLWHINRRSVAKGVACGLIVCFLPIPGQTVLAVLLAFLLSANLPMAILATWASNPFTFIPFNLLICQVGAWALGAKWSSTDRHVLSQDALHWFLSLGKIYAVGLPIVSIGVALIGYFIVQIVWKLAVIWKRKQEIKNFRTQK